MMRILHLTDLHLRWYQPGTAGVPARLSREIPRVLDALSEQISRLNVDLVTLTGDLLDVPNEIIDGAMPAGYEREAWLVAVEQDLFLIRDWFEALRVPYVICPGNHDHEPSLAKVFPEAVEITDAVGFRFVCFWDELGPDRQPRRTDERLDLFCRVLEAPEHDVPQIHIQHYTIEPPTLHNNWRYEYAGAQSMKERLEQSGRVHAVLSGHYHPGTLVRDGGVLYTGAPAFCEAPHHFRIYDFSDLRAIQVEDHSVAVPN